MNRDRLISEIKKKKSFLCIGLDTDIDKIPEFLHDYEDPIFEFNKRIIDHTADVCVSYKLNIAFYESLGVGGWNTLEKTVRYIPEDQFVIADAKRGDIGNTSNRYAVAFFEKLSFDAITVAPYMGEDSIRPFLGFDGKWVIILALTSNPGSNDFQFLHLEDGTPLYQKVLEVSGQWGSMDDTMYVVGATHPGQLIQIRKTLPHHFLLIPGVGKQGGDLKKVVDAGYIKNECGLLINSSRGIIYAGSGKDFAEKARDEALKLQTEMAKWID